MLRIIPVKIGPSSLAKLVNITIITRLCMIRKKHLITIFGWGYEPIYNWRAPSCSHNYHFMRKWMEMRWWWKKVARVWKPSSHVHSFPPSAPVSKKQSGFCPKSTPSQPWGFGGWQGHQGLLGSVVIQRRRGWSSLCFFCWHYMSIFIIIMYFWYYNVLY